MAQSARARATAAGSAASSASTSATVVVRPSDSRSGATPSNPAARTTCDSRATPAEHGARGRWGRSVGYGQVTFISKDFSVGPAMGSFTSAAVTVPVIS